MKTNLCKLTAAALLATAVATSAPVFAQTTVATTTTTSAGTISEFSPDTLVIRSTTAPEPIRYRYSKTTTYVDETGAPVSLEVVKSGLPVTVHYAREGDALIASKVIVRRSVAPAAPSAVVEERKTITAPVPAPAIEEKKTTTTTTTTK